MRIVAVGVLQKEDITCKTSPVFGLNTVVYFASDTMATEYEWSQIEPATAIFCACIVTYGPLLPVLGNLLPRASKLVSRPSQDSPILEHWTDMSNNKGSIRWPVAGDFRMESSATQRSCRS